MTSALGMITIITNPFSCATARTDGIPTSKGMTAYAAMCRNVTCAAIQRFDNTTASPCANYTANPTTHIASPAATRSALHSLVRIKPAVGRHGPPARELASPQAQAKQGMLLPQW